MEGVYLLVTIRLERTVDDWKGVGGGFGLVWVGLIYVNLMRIRARPMKKKVLVLITSVIDNVTVGLPGIWEWERACVVQSDAAEQSRSWSWS